MSCSPINNHRVRKWYLVMKTLFIKMVRIGVTLLRCYVLDMEDEGFGAFKYIIFSHVWRFVHIWLHLVKVTGVTLSNFGILARLNAKTVKWLGNNSQTPRYKPLRSDASFSERTCYKSKVTHNRPIDKRIKGQTQLPKEACATGKYRLTVPWEAWLSLSGLI